MTDYEIVNADEVKDVYVGEDDVPGEFRALTEALGSEQVAVTLIRVPPHADFEQGTGHRHDRQEEVYILTRGTLSMRFGDEVREVSATKVEDFWETSRRRSKTSLGRVRRRAILMDGWPRTCLTPHGPAFRS